MGKIFGDLIALTRDDEIKQLAALFEPYKQLYGLKLAIRIWDEQYEDRIRHEKWLLSQHVHTCIDGLCTPKFCWACYQWKCEQEFTLPSHPYPYCNQCVLLLWRITGYHINGCAGCFKVICIVCYRELCRKAFPIASRGKICHVCHECQDTPKARQEIQWFLDLKERSKGLERAGRLRRKEGEFKISMATRNQILEIFDNRCAACHRQGSVVKLTIDHVVPIALNGDKDITNAQVLCNRCNVNKSAGTIDYRTPEQIAKLMALQGGNISEQLA